MRKLLFLGLFASLALLVLVAQGNSQPLTHPFLAKGQSGAAVLAYYDDECDDCVDDSGWVYTPYNESAYYEESYYQPADIWYDELDRPTTMVPDQILVDDGEEYVIPGGRYTWDEGDGPLYVEPADYYYEIGYDEPDYVIVDAPEPWYERMLPGIGNSLSYILPPILRSNPTPTPPPQPTPQSPRPDCSLIAQPLSIAYGGKTTLSWTSRYATRATLSNVGEVATAGSRQTPNLTVSTMYGLTVSGPGGIGACYTTVAVAAQPQGPLSCVISTNPNTIQRGQSASLAWGSQYAVRAVLAGVGAVQPQGGMSVSPSNSADYALTVYSQSGASQTCTTHLTVR